MSKMLKILFLTSCFLLLEEYLNKQGMDFKTTNIEGIRIDDYSLRNPVLICISNRFNCLLESSLIEFNDKNKLRAI
ncbi:MAG: hypothetical protein ACLUD4_02900 [Thomasclavelia spiroformis]